MLQQQEEEEELGWREGQDVEEKTGGKGRELKNTEENALERIGTS